MTCEISREKKYTHTHIDLFPRARLVNNFSFFVRTRAQIVGIMSSTTRPWERRIGKRDVSLLWDVIVNDDDICFEHILPRLNRNEVKFLYGVNAETRALIKRSSRERELKWSFRVSEMLSISTLEIAWKDRSLGGSKWLFKRDFCEKVARTNKLELLKWAREVKKCEWDKKTIAVAAEQGNLEMVKYCVANRCPIDALACANAARNGDLECLKYLHEDVKAPWGEATVRSAHEYNHSECLQYLLDNDCPLPQGWSYEHGILNKPRL